MTSKMFVGMFNAPKEKRYKSFVTHAADNGEVWLLQENQLSAVLQGNALYVWPSKELVLLYNSTANPVMMDVEDFISECREKLDIDSVIVHVFPNDIDSYDVLLDELLEYMQEEVDRI